MNKQRDWLPRAHPRSSIEYVNPDLRFRGCACGILVRDAATGEKRGHVRRVCPIKNGGWVTVMLNQVEESAIFLLILELENVFGSCAEVSMYDRNVLVNINMQIGSTGAVKRGPQAPLPVLTAEEESF